MEKTNALAYVRVVVGAEGNVVHICPDSLYHPDLHERAFIDELLEGGHLPKLNPAFHDCQVLVVFKLDEEDRIAIKNMFVVQENFKEFWQDRINLERACSGGSLRDEVYIQERIEQWEAAYNDVFTVA